MLIHFCWPNQFLDLLWFGGQDRCLFLYLYSPDICQNMQFILLPPLPSAPPPTLSRVKQTNLNHWGRWYLDWNEVCIRSQCRTPGCGYRGKRWEGKKPDTLVCKEQKMNVLFLLLSSSLHSQPGNTELQLQNYCWLYLSHLFMST